MQLTRAPEASRLKGTDPAVCTHGSDPYSWGQGFAAVKWGPLACPLAHPGAFPPMASLLDSPMTTLHWEGKFQNQLSPSSWVGSWLPCLMTAPVVCGLWAPPLVAQGLSAGGLSPVLLPSCKGGRLPWVSAQCMDVAEKLVEPDWGRRATAAGQCPFLGTRSGTTPHSISHAGAKLSLPSQQSGR